MHHSLAEAAPAKPPVVPEGDRRTRTLEVSTLTAAVLEVFRYGDGRCGARLNAFVDGLGHRVVLVELSPRDHERACLSLLQVGALVRCSGVLVGDGQCLLDGGGLELLIADDRA